MTNEEKQEIVQEVLAAIRANSARINDLPIIDNPADNSYMELSGGKRISMARLRDIITGDSAGKPEFITDAVMSHYENRKCKLGGLVHNRPNGRTGNDAAHEISVEKFRDFKSLGLDYVITSFQKRKVRKKNNTTDDVEDSDNWENFKKSLENAATAGIDVLQSFTFFNPYETGNKAPVDDFDFDAVKEIANNYSAFKGVLVDEPNYMQEDPSEPGVKKTSYVKGSAEFYARIKEKSAQISKDIIVDINLHPAHAFSGYFFKLERDSNNDPIRINEIKKDGSGYDSVAVYSYNIDNHYAEYIADYAKSSDTIGCDLYPVKNVLTDIPKEDRFEYGGTKINLGDIHDGYEIDTLVQRSKDWAITMNCLLTAFHNNPTKEYTFFIHTVRQRQFVSRDNKKYYLVKGIDGVTEIEADANKFPAGLTWDSLTADNFYVNNWNSWPAMTRYSLSLQCYCALICGVSDIRYFTLSQDCNHFQFDYLSYSDAAYKGYDTNYERNNAAYNIIKEFNTVSKFQYLKDYITTKYIYGIDIFRRKKFVCNSVTDKNIKKIKSLVSDFVSNISDMSPADEFMTSIGFDGHATYCFIVNLNYFDNLTIKPRLDNFVQQVVTSGVEVVETDADDTILVEPGDICILRISYEDLTLNQILGASNSSESVESGEYDRNSRSIILRNNLGAVVCSIDLSGFEPEYIALKGFNTSEGDETDKYRHGEYTIERHWRNETDGREVIGSHAYGKYSVALGKGSNTPGQAAQAEGWGTIGQGDYSHAENADNKSVGRMSHSGGHNSVSGGDRSFSHGHYAKTLNANEVAFGKFNKPQTGSNRKNVTVFTIGNGTYDTSNVIPNEQRESYELTAEEIAAGITKEERIGGITVELKATGYELEYDRYDEPVAVKRSNLFEVRQNGDMYLLLNGESVKLQDYLAQITIPAGAPEAHGGTDGNESAWDDAVSVQEIPDEPYYYGEIGTWDDDDDEYLDWYDYSPLGETEELIANTPYYYNEIGNWDDDENESSE